MKIIQYYLLGEITNPSFEGLSQFPSNSYLFKRVEKKKGKQIEVEKNTWK